MKVSAAKAKNATAQGLSTLGGLIVAKFAMNLAGGKIPAWAVPMLGALGFVPHFASDDDNLKAFGNGVIAAGAVQGLQLATAGKTGIMGKVNEYLPALNAQTVVVQPPATAGFGAPNDNYAQLVSGLGNYPMAEYLVN